MRWLNVGLTVVFVLALAAGLVRVLEHPEPRTLRILAGSELVGVLGDRSLMADLKEQTGITLQAQYEGTLEGVERIAAEPGTYDLAWFSSTEYLEQRLQTTLPAKPIMTSPVVLGVRRDKAAELGWHDTDDDGVIDERDITWADIAAATGSGRLQLAMTDPAKSNSGFAALTSVATEATRRGPGEELTAADVTPDVIAGLVAGQELTGASSGWLGDEFLRWRSEGHTTPLDGMVNYESELLKVRAEERDRTDDPLEIVYPTSALYADYPLALLDHTRRSAYDDLVEWLRSDEVQQRISDDTRRRPAVGDPTTERTFFGHNPLPIDWPRDLPTITALTQTYNELRRPSRTVYVLDTSGSMLANRGPDGMTRIAELRAALRGLAGDDVTVSGRFSRFRAGDDLTILPYASSVGQPQQFSIPTDPARALTALSAVGIAAGSLPARGGHSALYSALDEAYRMLAGEDDLSDYTTSVVLMTDGGSTPGAGESRAAFLKAYAAHYAGLHVRTHVVLFGAGARDRSQMDAVAHLTGGTVSDASRQSLQDVFKEIRGYQ
ncbi:MAG: VWA domain-containing protein [Nocardioides sp.]|nr:VWA domain-containing protein [Nocardioides sp.]